MNWWQRYATGISHLKWFESLHQYAEKEHTERCALSLANNPNFDTNATLFEVRGKVILEGVMHHIRPINLDLRL